MNPRPIPVAQALALGRLDAHDQAALVRRGELLPSELVEAAIVRARQLDPVLGVLSHEDFDGARQRARMQDAVADTLPMAGVAWLPKDSLRYPGMPTRCGSRSHNSVPADAAFAFASRFDAAGLVAIGKSTMPEFGLMGSTEPLLGPIVRNPWSQSHSAGGSSGGAGAALAAGIVPLAHGSDGAGSIRIPASACGVVGLKPGRGATVSVRDRHAIEDLLVADSLMSRSVRDCAWAFAATQPWAAKPVTDTGVGRLRIAVMRDSLPGARPDAQVARALSDTAALCERLGHRVEHVRCPVDGPAAFRALYTLWSRLGADCVEMATARLGGAAARAALEPWTLELARWHHEHCGIDALEQAYAMLATLPLAFASFHRDCDVLLSPVLRSPPPPIGQLAPDRDFEELMSAMFDWISYTPLQNLAGTPAISLPLAQSASGLPIGLQFAADRGQESCLLSLALELENAAPWCDRWPATSVANELKEVL